MQEIVFVKNRSEIGAGTRGTSLAADAIQIAAVNQFGLLLFDLPWISIPNLNQWLKKESETRHAKYIEPIIEIYHNIIDTITPQLKDGKFPLILSGDHSNAAGTIAAIERAYPGKRIGVVWIDAHADMHSPYTTPSGNMHGMPLTVALGEDNLDRKINSPDVKTVWYWNELKAIGGRSPMIYPGDLVYVGLRSWEEPEEYLIKKYNIPNFRMIDITMRGVEAIAGQILEKLSDTDVIYISFDVDSMDMEISRGTGTPVKDGLSKHQAIELIKLLAENPKTVAFEVVEVNPLLDLKGNLMAEIALEAILSVVKIVQEKH